MKTKNEDKAVTKKFRFFTNTLKAIKGEDGSRYVVGIASSTSIDRDNDRMSESALQTMKSTAEANLTLFTNHEYKVPDDLFGSCVDATIKAKKDEDPITLKVEDGDEEVEIATFQPQTLEIKIKVVSDKVNPKASQIYNAVEEGVGLGFSIGGAVKKFLQVKDSASNVMHTLIDAIDLYEISIVGIPANADAMNVAIAKSLKGTKQDETTTEDLEEIMNKTIKKEEKEYTDEGISKHLIKQLKKDYDEWGYTYEQTDEEKREEEKRMQNWARAQAENVLMAAGEGVTILDLDDHTIHLQSHAWEMEYRMDKGHDTEQFAKHIKKHLKKLQAQMKADEGKE